MVTVILKIELALAGVSSLKEKRRILKSLITKLQNNFNISIAEVESQDVYRRAVLGAAIVSNSANFGNQVIAKVVNQIEANPQVVIVDYSTENY